MKVSKVTGGDQVAHMIAQYPHVSVRLLALE